MEGRATLDVGPEAQGPPLTVLVDKDTASAAEVFAAAVRYGTLSRIVAAVATTVRTIRRQLTFAPRKHGDTMHHGVCDRGLPDVAYGRNH